MSEQPPSNVPEKFNPYFDAKKTPEIASYNPELDPNSKTRSLENFIAQQQIKKEKFNPDKYYAGELAESGMIKEKITDDEKKMAEDFLVGFRERLKDNKLRGNDFYSSKIIYGKGRSSKPLAPGDEGYSIDEWQKNKRTADALRAELTKEEINEIAQAKKILSVEKSRWKHENDWKSIKIVCESNNKIVVIYLMEKLKNKIITTDIIVIYDKNKGEREKEVVSRKGS